MTMSRVTLAERVALEPQDYARAVLEAGGSTPDQEAPWQSNGLQSAAKDGASGALEPKAKSAVAVAVATIMATALYSRAPRMARQ